MPPYVTMPDPRSRFALVTLVALLGFNASAVPPTAPPPAPGIVERLQPLTGPALGERIGALAEKALKAPGAAGLAIAVLTFEPAGKSAADAPPLRPELLFASGFGLADVENKVPVTTATVFRLASVSKQFSAAAVMQLVQQGKLNLDAPLTELLPDLPVFAAPKQWPSDAALPPITLRHLLNHTSGIYNYTNDGVFMSRTSAMEVTEADVVALFAGKPLDFAPGSQFAYSNSGYYLLGLIIARTTGMSYAHYVQHTLAKDAAMPLPSLRHDDNHDLIAHRARGHSLSRSLLPGRPGKLALAAHIGTDAAGAAGGLVSNVIDLAYWQALLFRGSSGGIVSDASLAAMLTPPDSTTLAEGEKSEYGFGLDNGTVQGRRMVNHSGGIHGFVSFMMTLPDDGICIAVLANSDATNAGKLANDVLRAMMNVPEPTAADLPVPETVLQAARGTYGVKKPPLSFRFFSPASKPEALSVAVTGQGDLALLYQGEIQGKHEFRASFDSTVRLVFDQPEAGSAEAPSFTLYQGGREVVGKRAK